MFTACVSLKVRYNCLLNSEIWQRQTQRNSYLLTTTDTQEKVHKITLLMLFAACENRPENSFSSDVLLTNVSLRKIIDLSTTDTTLYGLTEKDVRNVMFKFMSLVS